MDGVKLAKKKKMPSSSKQKIIGMSLDELLAAMPGRCVHVTIILCFCVPFLDEPLALANNTSY